MPGVWAKITDSEPQKPGVLYRVVMSVRLPYPQGVGAIKAALAVQASVNGDLETVSMEAMPPLAGAHTGGKLAPWPFIWTYRVRPDGPNVGVLQAGMLDPWIVGAIVGVVIGALAALALVSTRFEKFVETLGEAGERLTDGTTKILEALVPVGILTLVALVVTRKGG